MQKFLFGLCLIALSGCGYEARDNETVGQIKKVSHQTPLMCPEYRAVDVSLGVMKNGTGSMSTEDIWFLVESESVESFLKAAQKSGKLVRLHYNVRRFTFCVPDHQVTGAELSQD